VSTAARRAPTWTSLSTGDERPPEFDRPPVPGVDPHVARVRAAKSGGTKRIAHVSGHVRHVDVCVDDHPHRNLGRRDATHLRTRADRRKTAGGAEQDHIAAPSTIPVGKERVKRLVCIPRRKQIDARAQPAPDRKSREQQAAEPQIIKAVGISAHDHLERRRPIL
jgi:hypothetical protein